MTTTTAIDTEQLLMQIGMLKSQIDFAEWEIGRICNEVKDTLQHGEFGDFTRQVWRVLNISHDTLNRYMKLNREFPKPIVQDIPLTTLYTLLKKDTPEPVRDFVIQERVQSPEMVKYAVSAYERRDVSGTWQELQVTKSIALDGESIHVGEVTGRDLRNMRKEQELIHAQGQGQEYRFTAYVESVEGSRAIMVISGGVDDLVKLAGREGVIIRAFVKGE